MTKELFIRKTMAVGTFVIALVAFAVAATPAKAEDDVLADMIAEKVVDRIVERHAVYYPDVHTPEWKTMTASEREASCRLSEKQMAYMPTDELLQAVMSNIFICEIFAFDSYELGFQQLCQKFPAIERLLARADFLTFARPFYKELLETNDDEQNFVALTFMEQLLAQYKRTNELIATLTINILKGNPVTAIGTSSFGRLSIAEKMI